MQRYGPPPSYPNLKIPGLNSPLPDGAHYGMYFNRPVDDVSYPPPDSFYKNFRKHGKPIISGNIYGTLKSTDMDDEQQVVGEHLVF